MEAEAYAALSVEEVKAAVENGDLDVAEALSLEAETGKARKGVLSLGEAGGSNDLSGLEAALAGRRTELRDTPSGLRALKQRLSG
ncbi:MAG: hypothetical protein LC798_03120 [Chloroflexi bacterium]|nr:hypothetical protein [Chloroflexota bacterium]